MSVSESAQQLALKRTYLRLGPGPWEVRNEHDVTGDPLLREIIDVTGIYAGDFASASLQRQALLAVGALTGVRNADNSISYTKCPFPDEPEDGLSWVDRENQRLAKVHAENVAWRDREYELAKQAQEMIDAPVVAAESAQFARQWARNRDAIRSLVRDVVQEVLAEQSASAGV